MSLLSGSQGSGTVGDLITARFILHRSTASLGSTLGQLRMG
jgi:hypothetical protein